MKYIANAGKSKYIDRLSTDKYYIPSIVLMERAAYETARTIMDEEEYIGSVLVVAGGGNNGADAMAVGRMLHEEGCHVDIYMVNAVDSLSEAALVQYNIAAASGVNIMERAEIYDGIFDGYGIIVDGIFGVGLSRDVTGRHAGIINAVNNTKARIYSVDVPSGINASTGRVMGTAVRAHHTVTFGLLKTGLVLYEGRTYAGKVSVKDIGFPKRAVQDADICEFCYDAGDIARLPARKALSNKGTYGRVLVAAGGKGMGGAAYMSAKSAYRSGCGLVKVLTCAESAGTVQSLLPEALTEGIDWDNHNDAIDIIRREASRADSVVIGPGLGTDRMACTVVENVIKYSTCNLVIDADAVNIIAKKDNEVINGLYRDNRNRIVITPHLKEMSRLSGDDISKMREDMSGYAMGYSADNEGIILALKDACTVVSDGNTVFLNTSGNAAMATGGSGDVLAGIIASFMAQGLERYEAACLGVYIHGLAGDDACKRLNSYSVIAGDIIESLCNVLQQ